MPFNAPPSTALEVGVEADYHQLVSVVMCLAHVPPAFDDTNLESDEALSRQLANNRFLPVDIGLVREQQLAFAALMEARGIEVLWADPVPGATVQYYTRDIAFVIGDQFVVARSQRPGRQQELFGIRGICARIPSVCHLEAGRIEGGDVLVYEEVILIGLGEETNNVAIESLRFRLDQAGIGKPIKVLELQAEGVIHTDTKLSLVGRGVAIADPTAFTPASWAWLRERYDIIEATHEEVWDVQVNTLALSPNALAMTTTAKRLAREVEARGIEPVMVNYTEVVKLPGSLRCSTLPLHRAAPGREVQ